MFDAEMGTNYIKQKKRQNQQFKIVEDTKHCFISKTVFNTEDHHILEKISSGQLEGAGGRGRSP